MRMMNRLSGKRESRNTEGPQMDVRVVRTNKVFKTHKGGKTASLSILVVVGDYKGSVGVGLGKARGIPDAIRKAEEAARKNMFAVPMIGTTIPHAIDAKHGTAHVILRPAAPGTGVIAGGAARAILEMAGIRDILAKSLGSSNGINVAHATIAGLKGLKRPDEIAALRGKPVEEVAPAAMLRAYRERRREADVFTEVN